MPYAEMYKVMSYGLLMGYYLSSEIGDYYLSTSDTLYYPFCSGVLDFMQISPPYESVYNFPSDLLQCVRYYNDLRGVDCY